MKDLWVTGQQSTGILCTPSHTQRCDGAPGDPQPLQRGQLHQKHQYRHKGSEMSWPGGALRIKTRFFSQPITSLYQPFICSGSWPLHDLHATPPVASRMDLPLCCAKYWAGAWGCPSLQLRLAKPPLKYSWHCVLHAVSPLQAVELCSGKRPSQPRHPASETFAERERKVGHRNSGCATRLGWLLCAAFRKVLLHFTVNLKAPSSKKIQPHHNQI